MTIPNWAWAGVGALAGMVIAALTVAPGMAAINDGMTCLVATCEDLAAQRSMAVAAWAMVGLTALGAAVGALSLALIFYTLDAARRSARAAEDTNRQAANSIEIAQESLAVTRRMAVAQTRSYVTCSGVAAKVGPNMRLRVEVKNSGTTPARYLHIALDVKILVPFPNGERKLLDLASPKVYLADLAAADKDQLAVDIGLPHENGDAMRGIVSGLFVITVVGHVSYQDIYSDRHPYVFGFEGKPIDAENYNVEFRLGRTPLAETDGLAWVE